MAVIGMIFPFPEIWRSRRSYTAQCIFLQRLTTIRSGIEKFAGLIQNWSEDHRDQLLCVSSSNIFDCILILVKKKLQNTEIFGERRKQISSISQREETKTKVTDIALKCYNNLAACILKEQNRTEPDYLRAVECCDKVNSERMVILITIR